MHNYVLKKKKKKEAFMEHRTHANHRQKPTHKSPTAAGMRERNRSMQWKKSPVLRLNERK